MGKNKVAPKSTTPPTTTKPEATVDMAAKHTASNKHDALVTAPNNLWYRLHALIFDLRHFRDKEGSVARLSTVIDSLYIGAPYFTASEADLIKSTITDGTPLSSIIENTMQEKLKRRKRTEAQDFRPCAAHDLAPLLERAFDIKHKRLDKSKHFQDLLRTSGLELKENQKFKGV